MAFSMHAGCPHPHRRFRRHYARSQRIAAPVVLCFARIMVISGNRGIFSSVLRS
jgi:hypothetical protein